MPITKGAQKAHRVSEKKRVFNVRRKGAMKDVTKEIQKAAAAGDKKSPRASTKSLQSNRQSSQARSY